MLTTLFKINNIVLFSLFFVFSLLSALFYTGNNTWLFTASYLFLVFNFAFVLKQRFHNSINISLNGLLISVILLLIWFGISILLSQIKYLSLYNFFWVGSLLIIFLLFTFNENKEQVWIYVWPGILLLVTVWALYALVQYYYLHAPTNATFLNRNTLAALINLALIPASGYFLIPPSDRPWTFLTNKALTLILLTLFLTIFIITSRGASLSLILGFVVLYLFLRNKIERAQLYSLITIIFIAFLLATLSQYFIQTQNFAERMMSLTDASKAGNGRYIIWKSLIPLFQEMPWYGLGLGSLWVFWPPHRNANDLSAGFFAHNDYAQITLEAGYPGIILLTALFIFIFIHFKRALKAELSILQHVELVSLFAALATFAAHSFFTYNFYVLPLLLIAGLYLARFNQIITSYQLSFTNFPALKEYFRPSMFIISLSGLLLIVISYFLSFSFSSHYNTEAKRLMKEHKFQDSNALFLKAQTLTPLMDNPFFSHADLLRRGADTLLKINKNQQANSLINHAHQNLDKAESLNPLRPQTHHIRGLIFERKEPKKAMIEYQKALKLDPRFLFSRLRLAELLHNQKQLKAALKVLYEGVDYNYPINDVMLEYMQFFAKLSRESGAESFAQHLESNINKFKLQNAKNH